MRPATHAAPGIRCTSGSCGTWVRDQQPEARSLGSKSAALELITIAVAMKVAIEEMRQQMLRALHPLFIVLRSRRVGLKSLLMDLPSRIATSVSGC
jgi:hypothetical protein